MNLEDKFLEIIERKHKELNLTLYLCTINLKRIL